MASDDAVNALTAARLRAWPLPEPGTSKRTRGHVLVCGGDRSTPGAVMLAGLAALRVGAGVLGLAVADSVASAVAVAMPEASVTALPGLDDASSDSARVRSAARGCDVVLVGPGLDDPEHARSMLDAVAGARDEGSGVVLDAFALGVLVDNSVVDRFTGGFVLTPNPSEAARLLDVDQDDLEDDPATAMRIALKFGATVTFSGCIASHGRAWRVLEGNAGLGTSGSGDVLAGAIAGLMARGADAARAACWATYLHAVAGDRLARRIGPLGFLARELADELPRVLVQVEARAPDGLRVLPTP